ncbi:17-beta-hydroxysteroid dehydrogenase type 3 isoform X2 [Lepisosteus oculatus]|uniref:17-beta-hydroxysteroid dehydrogenase type 3 isoform X2 n=1 Tax=Lepisosteus oculatus TaxID=7918 RepID=UPI00371C024F
MDSLELFFISVGALVFLLYLIKLIACMKIFFPKTWYPLPQSFFTSLGEWAVVTGGSDGIGRAYATEIPTTFFPSRGRTEDKLKKVAKEIEETTGQRVKVIVADFTKEDIYEHIAESIKELNVGVLVNNVGILSSKIPCRFLDTDDTDRVISNLINCNVKSLVKMSKIVLPGMEKRQKGLILNLSSGLAKFPCPLYTIYSASKVFVERFSRGLQAEYKSKGIIIQSVTPYGVSTPMTQHQRPNIITKTAEDFVRTSLNYILAGDQTYGCIPHQILGWIMQTIPLQVLHSSVVQEKFLAFVRQRVSENTSYHG